MRHLPMIKVVKHYLFITVNNFTSYEFMLELELPCTEIKKDIDIVATTLSKIR